jgi:hypothetical protein
MVSKGGLGQDGSGLEREGGRLERVGVVGPFGCRAGQGRNMHERKNSARAAASVVMGWNDWVGNEWMGKGGQ